MANVLMPSLLYHAVDIGTVYRIVYAVSKHGGDGKHLREKNVDRSILMFRNRASTNTTLPLLLIRMK